MNKTLPIVAAIVSLVVISPARANPAIIGIAIVAGEVLSPVASAVGIVKDGPSAWTQLQQWVDPRALELPPQPPAR